MFGLMGVLLAGLAVGIFAKILMPDRDPGGLFIAAILGIAGALVGGWLGQIIGLYSSGQPAGFITSVIGAILLLWAHRMIRSTV